ncbi:MAG: hypothetical protein AB1497_03250 [Bacillota bacterium]
MFEEVGEKLLDALIREQLVLAQVGCYRPDPRPVLSGLGHLGRKGRFGRGAATWAGLTFRPVFGHRERQARQVIDLAAFRLRHVVSTTQIQSAAR